jgi:DNA-directed RNA polymerase sigma subunit (sigma70/sigma32)
MRIIDAVSKVVRTSRRILHKIGREPTPEELAEKLGMPLERVRKVLKIAKEPLSLETPIGPTRKDLHLGYLSAAGQPQAARLGLITRICVVASALPARTQKHAHPA